MAYQRGELIGFSAAEICQHNLEEKAAEERGEWYDHPVPSGERGGYDAAIWLPHSCDEWVIGGVADLELLIADATALLAKLKA